MGMDEDHKNRNRLAFGVVTAVFFMWGFITVLNDVLVPHLKSIFALDYTRIMLIQFTFFGAYFLVSLPSGKLVSSFGCKNSIILGLAVAGLGALLFVTAAAIPSYGVFLTALFVLASGITLLQVAANPYVSLLAAPRLEPPQPVPGLQFPGHRHRPQVRGSIDPLGFGAGRRRVREAGPGRTARLPAAAGPGGGGPLHRHRLDALRPGVRRVSLPPAGSAGGSRRGADRPSFPAGALPPASLLRRRRHL